MLDQVVLFYYNSYEYIVYACERSLRYYST